MWGKLAMKIANTGIKTGKRIKELDPSSPINQDTLSFIVDIAKSIINPF